MRKILKEQFTERDYTTERLLEMYKEKILDNRSCKEIVEMVTHKPVYDGDGNVIGVRTDFPMELNIYACID